jgi:hypothetical protein
MAALVLMAAMASACGDSGMRLVWADEFDYTYVRVYQ